MLKATKLTKVKIYECLGNAQLADLRATCGRVQLALAFFASLFTFPLLVHLHSMMIYFFCLITCSICSYNFFPQITALLTSLLDTSDFCTYRLCDCEWMQYWYYWCLLILVNQLTHY